MRFPSKVKTLASFRVLRSVLAGAALLAATGAQAQIDLTNWGAITSPVYGTTEAGAFAGAELFAGPNRLGTGRYFDGVLPNGRKVTPAGVSVQIGMNPLGAILTPDGNFLITSNDDERDGNFASLISGVNIGGYSLSVVRTSDMKVVSQINNLQVYIGLQVKQSAAGYTVYASGGPTNNVRIFNVTPTGTITAGATITIAPILPNNAGYVSNYTNASSVTTTYVQASGNTTQNGNKAGSGAAITYPAGSALSPDGKYLYVACNGDNSLAVIDTTSNTVVKQIPVGYFPYGVSVSRDGSKLLVSNWGVTEYKFANATYDGTGKVTNITTTPNNLPDGFYVPVTSTTGSNPKTSSISVISVPGGNPVNATLLGSIYQGQPSGLDALYNVGDTHPSASAIVRRGTTEVLYVTKTNSDALGLILVANNRKLPDFDLSLGANLGDGHKVHGTYPNAIVVSPDQTRAYVAEAGLNSVAVLDTTNPTAPKLLGRIPTGWYPTALSISNDGKTLYVANAKGIGEDVNPNTAVPGTNNATGNQSFNDSNYIFGTAQKIDLTAWTPENTTVLANNYAIQTGLDTSIVPVGGAASSKIKHVFFILQENKTFDCYLGDDAHFGAFASTTFNTSAGATTSNVQFTKVTPNFHLLADRFAAAVNYYSDSEESDAGHQFAASGTVTDYTEKTLLNKSGRGLLVNKNFEPEDYPEGGYIYNNAARNGVSFRLYGLEAARIVGSDTGTAVSGSGSSAVTTLNDPNSGKLGYPALLADGFTVSLDANGHVNNLGDVDSATGPGVGHSFFMKMPGLAIVGSNNPSGLGRLDMNYPGYNFNISDQRRAKEFMKDFDAMVAAGNLPQFLYIYLPNSHTGSVQAAKPTGITASAAQQVADSDVALGMVVNKIMQSNVYYNPADGTGSAIFVVPDDAQSTLDHIHQHRSPMMLVSPYAKPGYLGKKHYDNASVVKTEELLLGLPANNLGDLLATDMRDLFQATYNGVTVDPSLFTRTVRYVPSTEGKRIWALASKLDLHKEDQDSRRLGELTRLSMAADDLHSAAVKKHHLQGRAYRTAQARLYSRALQVVKTPAVADND